MINVNLDNVKAADEYKDVTAGGYVAKIMDVEVNQEKQYLRLMLDIAEGEFKDYYTDLYERKDFWLLNLYRSYKQKALPFFKQFIDAVQASNPRYKWNGDETKLINKLVGIVLQEEEYTKSTGEMGVRLVVSKTLPVSDIREGKFSVPERKEMNHGSLEEEKSPVPAAPPNMEAAKEGFMQVPDNMEEGLPFN